MPFEQKLSYISQGGGRVTIAEGQTPVIYMTGDDPTEECAAAANFLRSGCPSVQIVFEPDARKDKLLLRITETMTDLALSKDEFKIASKAKHILITP